MLHKAVVHCIGKSKSRIRSERSVVGRVEFVCVVDVSPRVGHLQVTVDDAPWWVADASGEPVIINAD